MIFSIFGFLVSILLSYWAYRYACQTNVAVLPDVILDNIPVVHVAPLFFGGMVALILAPLVLCALDPRIIPFGFAVTALFFCTRSFFMVLTHFAPPSVEFYRYFGDGHHVREAIFTISSGTDSFFSGHAGFPFLVALIAWDHKYWRYLFLGFSALMAMTVLLGHLHYSIDVFSAYFIAYGVYALSRRFFKREFEFIMKGNYPA